MSEGFFRCKKGFTVVQNELTKDNSISLKAKGLYLVIQAYITMPDRKWTKDDFLHLAKEGSKAFDSAWKELKDTGYLKVHIMADGGKWRTEYELLDIPENGPHTFYHNSIGEITSDNVKRAAKKQLTEIEKTKDTDEIMQEDVPNKHNTTEINNHYPLFGSNGEREEDHYPHFGSNGNGSNGNGINGNGSNGNGGNKKNKDSKINTFNKNYNNTSNLNPNPAAPMENVDNYPMEYLEDLFGANDLILMGKQECDVDFVMEILYDTINTKKKEIWINKEPKSAEVVRARLLKLNSMDIEYAINQYHKQTCEIRYHKAYMLSILYVAKGQSNLDISNQVHHDMAYGYV